MAAVGRSNPTLQATSASAPDLGSDGRTERRTLAALTLAALPGVGDRGFRLAVDTFGSASEALRRREELQALLPRARTGSKPRSVAESEAQLSWQRAHTSGLTPWSYGGPEYPMRLNALHDPPSTLWVRGEHPGLVNSPTCAVVGSRRAGSYGLRMARSLGQALSSRGIGVVSGMAMGIDGAAHRGALEGAGGTIAVLGSGADVPTPRSQVRVYRQILAGGLVVSEFPPGSGAAPHNFPRRNRIIAALADAVVVVEAATRSGALITVDHALDLGVSVFAVPGPIDSARCAGSNALLADGAGVVLSSQTLVDAVLELANVRTPTTNKHSSPAAQPAGALPSAVWALLADGPLDVDGLTRELGEPASVVLGALGRMELDGWIECEPGARYARSPQA